MSRIPWVQVPEPTVEQMIAVLLSNMHQGDAARIDGRGGDGGRDVQIRTQESIRTFEIKSFTGRMTPSRRSKVQASLERAATLAPIDWTLLVPIDPNPKELEWFDWLRTRVPFPITWRGLTWLDMEFAQRPFIARYYLEDVKDEIIDLAKLLGQEKAVLAGGAPDAMERTRQLVERANDLDPFYKFRITSDGTETSIQIIPRYPGAERDRPITGGFQLEFPRDEAGLRAAEDFQRAIDFGTGYAVPEEYVKETSLDAPANLGGRFEKGRIELLPSRPPKEHHDLVLAITDAAGVILSEVPVSFVPLSTGKRGSILRGTDRTGMMTVDATVDGQEAKFKLKLTVRGVPFYPAEMRPLARFLAETRRPNILAICAPGGERIGHVALDQDEPLGSLDFPRLIDDLVLVQWAAGMTRKTGPLFTLDDAVAIKTAADLVRGVRLDLTWTSIKMRLHDDAPEEIRRSILDREFPFTLKTPEPHVAVVGGASYHIGKGMQAEILSATLAPGNEGWRTAGIVPAGEEVVLVPASSNKAFGQLISS
jgi:hypothetical protein